VAKDPIEGDLWFDNNYQGHKKKLAPYWLVVALGHNTYRDMFTTNIEGEGKLGEKGG